MITLLSPAKTLDFESPAATKRSEDLIFADKAEYLAKKLAKFKPAKLRKMMDISEDLANLNTERYAKWALPVDEHGGKQAMYAFKGDVYQGLEAEQFSEKEVAFAQDHVRILSGLYGVLRPLDLMLPYRLEMGTSWQITPKTKNLYAFWKKDVTKRIAEDVKSSGSEVLLNLASQEYAKAVNFKALGVDVIAPEFREERGDKFQMISFFAKKARGLMAAYVVKNQVEKPEQLKNFDLEGYAFNERLSDISANKWVYTRKTK
ncbi:MAG: peroxide stress protein YaaA [Cryomorphaceae bacterium]